MTASIEHTPLEIDEAVTASPARVVAFGGGTGMAALLAGRPAIARRHILDEALAQRIGSDSVGHGECPSEGGLA